MSTFADSRPWHRFYPEELPPLAAQNEQKIWSAIMAHVEANPNGHALSYEGMTISYAELAEAVEHLCEDLATTGVENPRIILLAQNSAKFVIAFLAASRVGVVTAPSSSLSAEELASQWRDFDPNIVLQISEEGADPEIDEALLLRAQFFVVLQGAETFVGEMLDSDAGKAALAPPPIEDLAVVQYTSGTTGDAKGAMMTHANLVTNAKQNAAWFGWQPDDVNVWMLPLCHTWGVCCGMLSTLITGAHLVVERPKRVDAKSIGGLFTQYGGSLLYASATFLYRLIDDPFLIKEDFKTLRIVKAGAMLTQGDLKERWDALFPHATLQQGYGLTEASPETHNNPPKRFKAGTVGIPIQSTDCRILDPLDPSKQLPIGEAGEVAIKGPQVFAGYWKKPEATAKTLIDGWLLTGDIGVMDEEGYLTIVDRKKDLLKFRGFSIAPAAIENVLVEHPAVDEVIVVGKRDVQDGEIPVAFIVGDEPLDEDDLSKFAKAHLARYEVPREFLAIASIPKNHVGKPLRRTLRELVNSETAAD